MADTTLPNRIKAISRASSFILVGADPGADRANIAVIDTRRINQEALGEALANRYNTQPALVTALQDTVHALEDALKALSRMSVYKHTAVDVSGRDETNRCMQEGFAQTKAAEDQIRRQIETVGKALRAAGA